MVQKSRRDGRRALEVIKTMPSGEALKRIQAMSPERRALAEGLIRGAVTTIRDMLFDPAKPSPLGAKVELRDVSLAEATWTGPRDDDWENGSQMKLKAPVPPERWPYGPPTAHEDICTLHEGGLFCDCAASDGSVE